MGGDDFQMAAQQKEANNTKPFFQDRNLMNVKTKMKYVIGYKEVVKTQMFCKLIIIMLKCLRWYYLSDMKFF